MKVMKFVPAVALLVPAIASAQPEPTAPAEGGGFDHEVAPVDSAFEIGVGAGYTQGVGKLGGGFGFLEDVSGAGAAVEIDLGYRVIPQLSLGVYGTFARYQRGDQLLIDSDVIGATAGIQATWHVRPDRSVDPWVSLGTGWRGLWLDPPTGKGTTMQGFELARLQIGADYRVSRDIAIAPVIGGSLSMFVSEDSAMTTSYEELTDKQVNFTGFAGLTGRFDLGGRR
jgi:hypothetical protein